jgi:Protein of unknown function (DUF3098)
MATVTKKPQPGNTQPVKAAPTKAASPAPQATKKPVMPKSAALPRPQSFLFDKTNYTLMAAGVALIFIGFVVMTGGKSPDPHQFNYDKIYSFTRITLAPIIILAGFALEVYAIMKLPKDAVPAEVK